MTGIENTLGYVKGKIGERKDYALGYLAQRPYLIPLAIAVSSIALASAAAAMDFTNTGSINGHSYIMHVDTINNTTNLVLPESLKNISQGVDMSFQMNNLTSIPHTTQVASVQNQNLDLIHDQLSQTVNRMMGR